MYEEESNDLTLFASGGKSLILKAFVTKCFEVNRLMTEVPKGVGKGVSGVQISGEGALMTGDTVRCFIRLYHLQVFV